MQGVWVRSLVLELKGHVLCSKVTKLKQAKPKKQTTPSPKGKKKKKQVRKEGIAL